MRNTKGSSILFSFLIDQEGCRYNVCICSYALSKIPGLHSGMLLQSDVYCATIPSIHTHTQKCHQNVQTISIQFMNTTTQLTEFFCHHLFRIIPITMAISVYNWWSTFVFTIFRTINIQLVSITFTAFFFFLTVSKANLGMTVLTSSSFFFL